MHGLLEEQFILAKFGISLTESNNLPDFEREAYVNLATQYMKAKAEAASMSHLVDD